jgi:hypothetical protein
MDAGTTLACFAFLAVYLAGVVTPRVWKFLGKCKDEFIEHRLCGALRKFLHYNGEGTVSIKALLELVRLRSDLEQKAVEILWEARGARCICSPSWDFCPGYTLIAKDSGQYSNHFLVFCHDDEKERFCKKYPQYVVQKDPFELRGERPKELPRGVLNN